MSLTWVYPSKVIEVVDGDTVKLWLDMGLRCYTKAPCRLLAIDTEEMHDPDPVRRAAAQAAKAFVQDLLPVGAEVSFASVQLDKYGRPLGHLTLRDGRDLSDLLRAAGFEKKVT